MIALALKFTKSAKNGSIYCDIEQNYTNYFTVSNPPNYIINDPSFLIAQIKHLIKESCKTEFSSTKASNPIKLSNAYLIYILDLILLYVSKCGIHCKVYIENSIITMTFRLANNPPWDGATNNISNYSITEILEIISALLPTHNVDNSMTKLPNPKNPNKPAHLCDYCRTEFTTTKSLATVPISTGETKKLCGNCLRTDLCQVCKFKEPRFLMAGAIKIRDDTGQNQQFLICLKCTHEHKACAHCGRHFNFKEDGICPCQVRSDFKSYIREHNADVLSFYPMDSYSNELFGVEIECGTLNQNRRRFKEIASTTLDAVNRNAILKYDSSIDWINKNEGVNNDYKGFEVVTRPMVYKNSMRFLKNFCKGRHPLLRSWEVATCGLHIHVSKSCLRPFDIGKILEFVNNKGNRSFIKMIAKREDKRFAKFVTKKILDYQNNTPGGNGVTQEHYEAVNVSKPYTIEFRIFRGTLNPQTVASYLQFVKSLVDFVKVTPRSGLTHYNYKQYLFSTEKSRFRELKHRIESENTNEIKKDGEI